MRPVGRKTLIALLVILLFFLSWFTTMAVSAYRIHSDSPTGIDLPVPTETAGADTITLILLGAGILNLAIWGRNQCRRGSTKPGESG